MFYYHTHKIQKAKIGYPECHSRDPGSVNMGPGNLYFEHATDMILIGVNKQLEIREINSYS